MISNLSESWATIEKKAGKFIAQKCPSYLDEQFLYNSQQYHITFWLNWQKHRSISCLITCTNLKIEQMVSIDKCLALLSYLMNQNHCQFCFYQINCLQLLDGSTRRWSDLTSPWINNQISEMWSMFSFK